MAQAFRNPHLFWVRRLLQSGGAAGATWVARPIRSPDRKFILTSAVPRTQAGVSRPGKTRNAGSVRVRASRLGLHHTQLPTTGEGSHMKANLKTSILPLLTAAISCAL